MKIAIYELIHLELVLPLCELFEELDHEVSFCTPTSFENDIRENISAHLYSKFDWVYVNDKEKKSLFLSNTKKFLRSKPFDIIILNSVDFQHAFLYHILKHQPAYVLINLHDINNFFKSTYSLNIRKLIRTIGKRLLAKRADGFLVNFEHMKDYISQQKLTSKTVYHLPPVISKAEPPVVDSAQFCIVVSGSIDQRRRDYELILNAWERWNNKKALLILAGRPVGKYGLCIVNKAKGLVEKGFSITYFTKEIPEREFQKLIAGASFLLSPLIIKTTIHDEIYEEYGLSKCSGNIYDAIRHGKPLFIPKGLQVPQSIESSCVFFKNEDLARLLEKWFSTKNELHILCSKAYQNSLTYSKAKIQQQLITMIESIKFQKTTI